MITFFSVILGLLLSACGGEGRPNGGDVDTFSTEKVGGLIAGEPWAYKSGRAKRSVSNDGTYKLELWDEKIADPCSVFMGGSDRSILGDLPLEAGSYSVGLTADVSYTLVDTREAGMSMNYFGESGQLEVDSKTASTISGKLKIHADEQNKVNGTFKVVICY